MKDTLQDRHRNTVAGWVGMRFGSMRKMLSAGLTTKRSLDRPKLAALSVDSRQQKRSRALVESFQSITNQYPGEPRAVRRRIALKLMRKTWRAEA